MPFVKDKTWTKFGHDMDTDTKSVQSKRLSESLKALQLLWLREGDLNPRPPGYEPDELPTALSRVIILSV